MYILIVSSVAVAIVVFILYLLERKSKSEEISWETALKLSLFGGLLTSGVVFATTAESIPEIVKAVEDLPQEMFVGTPSF